MLKLFQEIGRDLFLGGMVTSHGGNMSVRMGDDLLITKRGTMLGSLKRSDFVKTTVAHPHPSDPAASSELPVHRAIYSNTPAMAIVHAHPVHAVALSLLSDAISPLDLEGSYLLGRVLVVEAKLSVESGEAADLVPSALRNARVMVLRGHGSFAIGEHLEEAFHWTSVLEHSCQIAFLLRRT